MPDNKRKKKADARRVSLEEGYERYGLAERLASVASRLHHEADLLESQVIRLRSGFPEKRVAKKGKR